MALYKTDPHVRLVAEVVTKAKAWKKSVTDERCECGRRTHRTKAEIDLANVLARLEQLEEEKKDRFFSEAPTHPSSQALPDEATPPGMRVPRKLPSKPPRAKTPSKPPKKMFPSEPPGKP